MIKLLASYREAHRVDIKSGEGVMGAKDPAGRQAFKDKLNFICPEYQTMKSVMEERKTEPLASSRSGEPLYLGPRSASASASPPSFRPCI
ncbi:hypothetical protein FB192DRAFT_1448777 [Mucor lusitanicus]|uniref:Uncharacterized protein n=1 Tax=Mucor circinelloides f. lusitanicus TaxID=29924 RepID=A0A8H4F0G0_MUCCL|nr:hypothetical protein FB192DRAFT_1448777 [Mucor lusitanicus]